MANYLFIASREADETFGGDDFTNWVTGLQAQGHSTTVFLTQNAVIAARRGAVHNTGIRQL